MRMPALGPAVMVPVGVKVTVTVVATLLTGLPSVMARFTKGLKICGKEPLSVLSNIAGTEVTTSREVAARMLADATAAALGLVNLSKFKLMAVFAGKVPAVSRILKTLVLTMLGTQAGEPVAPWVTVQMGLLPISGDPASVMRMPAFAEPVMALVRAKATVAVVGVLLTWLPSVTARPATKESAGNAPDVVASIIVGDTADKSLEVPAATVVSAACALFGVVNCWKCKLI